MIPPPTPVLIQELLGIEALTNEVGDRIGTDLEAPLPALRVALAGYQGGSATGWESMPMFQVDVWAETEGQAEALAWHLVNYWPDASSHVLEQGGAISGRWIVQLPISLPPDDDGAKDTGYSRYMVTVGFRLTSLI